MRTHLDSQAQIKIIPISGSEGPVVKMGPGSRYRTPSDKKPSGLVQGLFHFFSRKAESAWAWETETVSGGVHRTDFIVGVHTDGETFIVVDQGQVRVTNKKKPENSIDLMEQEAAWYDPKEEILKKVPYFDMRVQALAQTFLYYPGVLHLEDLALTQNMKDELKGSLSAYAAGNLPLALAEYPVNREPVDNAEELYLASLVLVCGQFHKAESLVRSLSDTEIDYPRQKRIAEAILQVIAGVQGSEWKRAAKPASATEWLAESYYQQSRAGLSYSPSLWEREVYGRASTALYRALIAAEQATPDGSTFGFGWVRRAELEFGFGRAKRTEAALAKAGEHRRSNAQAVALAGFLAWARNDYEAALKNFQDAAALDSRLGNALLGIGLTQLRRENVIEYFRRGRLIDYWRAKPDSVGLSNLEAAVAAEPDRSLLRSYLGKAYYELAGLWGDTSALKSEAFEQLELAKRLDANDPTPYLYSALIKQQENRINEAIGDLERSIERNSNRQVYRSSLLLDQDLATRSASLARIYERAGLTEVSVREAARAVSYDYGNYSAHSFLAQSFNALRDPTRFNLRYETAWFNELLLANLLAPVGAGLLSQSVSQQEYSKLFETDGIGLLTDTEVRSDGQIHQVTSQYGTFGGTSYSLDLDYQHNDGVRPNNDLSRIDWYSQIKQQLTPQDTLFLLTEYQTYRSGDNYRYLDPSKEYSPSFRYDEEHKPVVVAAYHREWIPGVHTLLMAGRLVNRQDFSDDEWREPTFFKDPQGNVTTWDTRPFDLKLRDEFETYTVELQQILQREHNTLIVGSLVQSGQFHTSNLLTAAQFKNQFANPPAVANLTDDFNRASGYAYYTRQLSEPVSLTVGLSYDDIKYPENFRHPPVRSGEASRSQINPKAALVWSPRPEIIVRGVYTRTLGGVSFDESYRLEPAQLAGFSQAFRTVIPESVVGSVSAPQFETAGAALDLKFRSRTYIGLQGENLQSEVNRTRGVFEHVGNRYPPFGPPIVPSSTSEELDYAEQSFAVTVNQLVGNAWAFGAQYMFLRSELDRRLPSIPASIYPDAQTSEQADLHRVGFYAAFHHSSGFFLRGESQYYHQNNSGYAPGSPELDGDRFQHLNLYLGYRFFRQRGEILVGLLNLLDEDYRLNPLNPYTQLPRERVFMTRLRLSF
ncbi:MAG: hypothetical protein HY735_38145 [Verrucomicrobia bacterium]|nr:hypothetical protein [Verrucomicrobiota bacterium]